MTYLDISTIHFFKLNKESQFDMNGLTNIAYVILAIKRQPERTNEILNDDCQNIIKNISKLSKKYEHIKKFITDVKDKFATKEFATIAFVCWYFYNWFDFKNWKKNSVKDITEDIQNSFKEWYRSLNANVHIIHGFKESCRNIYELRGEQETSAQCIERLLTTDKLAQTYYSGAITPYFLSAIPEKFLIKGKTSTFSNQLIDLISKNRELLYSRLNYAAKNYIGVPVNSIKYLNEMFG